MGAFGWVMVGMFFGFFLFLLLGGAYMSKTRPEERDWRRPTVSYEDRVAAEIDDLDQMLEAVNSRRRARGEAERTEHGINQQVREDLTQADKRRESYLAREDVEQLLATKNARRARRGLPPVTLEQYTADLERYAGRAGRTT